MSHCPINVLEHQVNRHDHLVRKSRTKTVHPRASSIEHLHLETAKSRKQLAELARSIGG